MEAEDRKMSSTTGQNLPQWNGKLSFSAQKPSNARDKNHASFKEKTVKTPLGKPRRVPLGKCKDLPVDTQAHASNQPASLDVRANDDKTPTVCLFQRFSQSLTISTPDTTIANSDAQQQCTADTCQKPGRTVAFGTPSMLTYTPAGPSADPAPEPEATPLWSNAGHTPYSLTGTDASKGCILEYGASRDTAHSVPAVRLFSSVITDTSTAHTPPVTLKPCLHTPLSITESTAGAAGLASTTAIPCTAGSDGRALQTLDSPPIQASTAADSSFTGFCATSLGSKPSKTYDSTPVLVLFKKPLNAANSSVPASTPQPGSNADAQCSVPSATPKSKLKQPARIPISVTRSGIPAELKQLLGEGAAGALVSDGAGQSLLGSCDVLSPVRSKKQQQHKLGATEQVLTPVRRSARKVSKELLDSARVAPMLEATNYCYQPNEALGDPLRHT